MAMFKENPPRRRVRRLLLGLTVVVLVATAGFCWWWVELRLLDEERPFVGTWRLNSPSPMYPARPELVAELNLMVDRTVTERIWNMQTESFELVQESPARWRAINGRFQEIIPGNPLHGLLGVGDKSTVLLDVIVVWDGPDRFQYPGPSGSHPTMIWSRCDRTGR